MDLEKLKIVDLKKLCKSSGISQVGTKSKLIARIKDFEKGQIGFEDLEEGKDVLADEKDVLEDEVLDADDDLIANEAIVPLGAQSTEEDLLGNLEDSEFEASPEKLPSNLQTAAAAAPAVVEKIPKSNVTCTSSPQKAEADPLIARAKRFGTASEQTQKEMRAQRFGIVTPTSLEAKKLERAKRFNLPLSNDTSTKTLSNSKITTDAEKLKSRSERFGTGATQDFSKTDADKLKSRSERFGVTVSQELAKKQDEEKIMMRKQRFGEVSKPDEETMQKRKLKFAASSSTQLESDKKKLRAQRFGITA